MALKTLVTVDVSEITKLGVDLSRISPEELAARMVDTINRVTNETYDLARSTMLSGINLTDAYVQRKMEVTPATGRLPVAIIAAPVRDRNANTNLSEYGAMTQAGAVNWSNERIKAMGKKFGPWPGWTRRIGAKGLGIPVNQKAIATSVEVKRGARKNLRSTVGFQVGKLKDGSGNPLVFERVGKKNIKAMYGPSVYQLFKVAAGKIEETVYDNLEQAVIETADKAMKEILA